MKKNDLVSVIIPTFKRPIILKKAIKSVLGQTYSNFEILVINDDIEEKSVLDIIKNLKDSRIKYYRNERIKGPCGGRNTGILKSKGGIIAFLDDDDIWLPDRLNRINNVFSKNDVNGAVTGYKRLYRNKITNVSLKKSDNMLGDYLADRFSLMCGSNFIVRKEIVNKIGLFDEELIRQEDTEYMIRYLFNYQLEIINEPLVVISINDNKPEPSVTIETRKQLENKIKVILNNLDVKYKNLFYSNHYRRLAFLYMDMGQTTSAFHNLKKAIKYKYFSPKKDIKLMLSLLRNMKK